MGLSLESRSLDSFFSGLSIRLDSAHKAQKIVDRRLATSFNPFGLLYPDENRISNFLSDLLDPAGSHGQGDTFLRIFIDILNIHAPHSVALHKLGVAMESYADHVRVGVEVRTERIPAADRRMDILIECNGHALMIENKPWAIDQELQMSDYMKHLDLAFGLEKSVMVYLSRDGGSPGASSFESQDHKVFLEQSGTLISISYTNDLVSWLNACCRVCEAPSVSACLQYFIGHIQGLFGVPGEK